MIERLACRQPEPRKLLMETSHFADDYQRGRVYPAPCQHARQGRDGGYEHFLCHPRPIRNQRRASHG